MNRDDDDLKVAEVKSRTRLAQDAPGSCPPRRARLRRDQPFGSRYSFGVSAVRPTRTGLGGVFAW